MDLIKVDVLKNDSIKKINGGKAVATIKMSTIVKRVPYGNTSNGWLLI